MMTTFPMTLNLVCIQNSSNALISCVDLLKYLQKAHIMYIEQKHDDCILDDNFFNSFFLLKVKTICFISSMHGTNRAGESGHPCLKKYKI